MGAATRRGSAPVIDTYRENHLAQLHALIQSQRSITPTPTVPETQSELSPSELHSEAENGHPFHGHTLPVLQVSPVSSHSEYRRLSDTSIRPSSEVTSEKSTLSVPSGRRHSDLSSLLSLTSHHSHHFAMQRSHTCQSCFSMLLLRSREGTHRCPSVVPTHLCPCDLRHHPSSGTVNTPGYGRQKGSSDCSDFSLLQQSLLNIISRKAAPCHTTLTQASLLHSSAAHKPACSDGDGSLSSHLLSGSLAGDQEPLQDCEDRICAGEQQVTRAVGGVCHNSRKVALASHMGPTPAYLISPSL